MNIIFMRHGEATDNVKELISDREIYWSVLTENGQQVAQESIKSLPEVIDKIYVSPFPRTIQTAHFVYEKYSKTNVLIDDRLHEINHGKYSGEKNNEVLDSTREKQIAGDYFIRLGEYGENRYDVEYRLSNFLYDVYKNNFATNTIMIVSHGSITSYMKRILNIKTAHIKTGKIEEFIDVDFSHLLKHIQKLKKIKREKINNRVKMLDGLKISDDLRKNLLRIAKQEFNNIEFPDSYFSNYIDGIKTTDLRQKNDVKFDDGVILICFYNDFANFALKWMKHYIKIGIKNYVLVDNNSLDNSTDILKKFANQVNISFWQIKEKYDCYKMCGWKQQIFEFYGKGHQFLTVDSDELFVYKDYQKITFAEYLKINHPLFIKSMMLDVYTNNQLFKGSIEDFKYVDRGTYKINTNVSYNQRFYGGPRSRIFGINPSLQKIPFITYSGKEVFANDHFYYPWIINDKAVFKSYLLHYKFLPDDYEKYKKFIEDERHWNNSHEYKIYSSVLDQNDSVTFYDKNISIPIEDIDYMF